ncbi:MAG: RdgB/HAM1 family non-canonical purine NTP pyrophosphatase [bacterium]
MSEKPKVLIATHNRDKTREILSILSLQGDEIDFIPGYEIDGWNEPDEDGDTIEENAIIKATSLSKISSYIALADDTGLEVFALSGDPGVLSSRYAGENATYEDNYMKLLREMKEVPFEKRTARFITVVACVKGEERLFIVDGILNGYIAEEPYGNYGFGYDPVFFIPSLGKTLAELTPEEKNRISHRSIAFKNAYKKLISLYKKGKL